MATASGGWAWVAEVAGEELAKLEAAHPGRFGPLKAELQRLVAEPGLDAYAFGPLSPRAGIEHCLDLDAAAFLLPRAGATRRSLLSVCSPSGAPLLHPRFVFHAPTLPYPSAIVPSLEAGRAPSRIRFDSVAHHARSLLCKFTESSTTRKRKPGGACERKDGKWRRSATAPPPPGGTKDRADMAIERAERCLERIRAIKRSLLAAWTH
ncbi:hypothetical protein EJB05_21905, partial [Eragrostis curvula]